MLFVWKQVEEQHDIATRTRALQVEDIYEDDHFFMLG